MILRSQCDAVLTTKHTKIAKDELRMKGTTRYVTHLVIAVPRELLLFAALRAVAYCSKRVAPGQPNACLELRAAAG
jgi:hypothetical protein